MAYVSRRRGGAESMTAWPGYVDALSTLLLVIIFVLLVFVLAQAFLSVALAGRSKALDKVTKQLAEVSNMLSLEKGHASELEQAVSQLNQQLAQAHAKRISLAQEIDLLQSKIAEATAAETNLKTQLAGAVGKAQANATQASQLQAQLADAQQRLADMKKAAAALNKTVAVNKETIQAKVADIAKLAEQVRALTALRDQLEQQAQTAAARAMTEKEKREAVALQLSQAQKLGNSARAQLALLNQQVSQLKAQLASVAKALDLAQTEGHEKDVEIADLGKKLNVALAAKVQELQRYRSDFFGKLRAVLANKPGIRIVGDRFVIESDVLFPVGSADLSAAGVIQISKIADTIKQLQAEIPPKIDWILDVDGYADRQPIMGGQYESNWQLSAARAISVVNLLVAEGVPPQHVSATAFAEYHPIDPADTPDAYAKNRRIEFRLTDYNRSRQAEGGSDQATTTTPAADSPGNAATHGSAMSGSGGAAASGSAAAPTPPPATPPPATPASP